MSDELEQPNHRSNLGFRDDGSPNSGAWGRGCPWTPSHDWLQE